MSSEPVSVSIRIIETLSLLLSESLRRGDIRFDSDARISHGEGINTRDVITFEERSVDELEKAVRNEPALINRF
jgi:hypothetical protein